MTPAESAADSLAARRLAEIDGLWRAASAYLDGHALRDQVRWRVELRGAPKNDPRAPDTGTAYVVITWEWSMTIKVEVEFAASLGENSERLCRTNVRQHKGVEAPERILSRVHYLFAPRAPRLDEPAAAPQGDAETMPQSRARHTPAWRGASGGD